VAAVPQARPLLLDSRTWAVAGASLCACATRPGTSECTNLSNPLLAAAATGQEPLFGPLIGWAIGVASAPGPTTWSGGAVVLAATCIVLIASSRRTAAEAAAEAAGLARRARSGVGPGLGADEEWGGGSGGSGSVQLGLRGKHGAGAGGGRDGSAGDGGSGEDAAETARLLPQPGGRSDVAG
jgi:hypothetical protein